MTWPKGKVLLAAALGGAGLLAVIFTNRDGSTGTATVRAAPPGRTAAGPARTASMPVVDLRLELLDQERPDLGEPERNPFRFRPRPAPRPAGRAGGPSPAVAAAPAPVTAPPVPSGPPPIPLRFIGLVEAPGQAGRVAILSDGRGNVFQGREGDILEGRYRVGRVSPDSLELSYADGRGRQVIRLSGQ